MGMKIQVQQPPISKSIQEFKSNQGAKVFLLPLEAFTDFWVNAYLVILDGYKVLIDTGSGFGDCNDQLLEKLREVSDQSDAVVDLSSIDIIFITHGHIDHYGGLPFLSEHTKASIGIHELDLRSLINPEERLNEVLQRLTIFLAKSGVPDKLSIELVGMYQLTKLNFSPVEVGFTFESIGMELGPFKILHVPGHCAGHIVIRFHDFLFSGDHILKEISPHQNPESLMRNTGLEHYLHSLKELHSFSDGINMTFPGHDGPISKLGDRINAIEGVHALRLQYIQEILRTPHTIHQVSKILFPGARGFNTLLALEETGAHVEYLYDRGILSTDSSEHTLSGNINDPIYYCLNPTIPGTDSISWY